MGHAGTLDPLASGLLIIGVGSGTKNLNGYLNLPKTYLVEIILGKRTETGDLEGKVLEEKPAKDIDRHDLLKVLKSLEGSLELPVPLFSAIKVKGQPLYRYAREGIAAEIPVKTMEVYSLKLINQYREGDYYILKIEVNCRKGTYIRSIAEELGKRLGYPSTVKELRRTRIGNFEVLSASKLEDF